MITTGFCYAESAIYELPAINTTTAPPFSYPVSSTLGNQVVISNSQIVRSGAKKIGQLVNNIAGVQYTPGVSAEPRILIHSEPALILVNGEPLANFAMSNPDINLIPLSEIQKIIITPSVAGTQYGNQSLGGVINIITKPITTTEHSISVLAGAPWMNQITGISGGPINQNNAYRLDVQNQFNSGYREHSQTQSTQGTAALQHAYASGSIQISSSMMHQSQDFPGYLTDVQISSSPKQSIAGQGQGTYQANTGTLGFTWIQNLRNAWQLKTHVSDRGQHADSNLEGTFTQTYNTFLLNPEIFGDIHAGYKAIHLAWGLSFSNETYSFDSPTLYDNIHGANQQQYSTYGNVKVPLTSNLSFSGSGRLTAIETAGQFFNNTTYQFNPESSQSQNLELITLGLNERLSPQTTLYFRRAMGYQLPAIDQSNFTANPNTGFGLQATTSTAYETGVNWQGSTFQWEAEAFLINLKNEIGFFTPPNGIAANYNLSPTRRQGLTGDANYQLNQYWNFGTSLTLMNNYFREGTNSGNTIPGSADTLANFNAHYQVNPTWSLYVESQYTGSEFADGDNENVSTKIPGYWIENVAINAEFPSWLMSLRLDNVTNTQYYIASIYDAFLTTPTNNPVAYYPAPERTVMLSLTYRFH